jgi:hypothetical protein
MGEFRSCHQILIHKQCFSVLPSHLSWAIKLLLVNITHLWVSQNARNIYRDSLFRDVTWCKLVAGYYVAEDYLTLEDGTNMQPQNFRNQLPTYTMWYSRRPKASTKMWQSLNYHREYLPNSMIDSFSYTLLDRVTDIWECLWCDAVVKQKWNVKGTMVTAVRLPMTFIKFTHLRGNNLTNSAQATLKNKSCVASKKMFICLG